jgi:hypothetical protein
MSNYGHLMANMCPPTGKKQKEDKEKIVQSIRLRHPTEL